MAKSWQKFYRQKKGTDIRTTKRIYSLLQIIPLAKAHLRYKLIFGQDTYYRGPKRPEGGFTRYTKY
jgi:hypothetical protein